MFLCIHTSLTSQSALATEAVGARTAIKGRVPATKTRPIHLRPQRDRMQATYSSPKPTHKNSRKNESMQEAFEVRHLRTILIGPPASLKAGYPPRPCVLLWMNCFLFHFGSIFLYNLTELYCSPGPWGGRSRDLPLVKGDSKSVAGDAGCHCRICRRMTPHLLQPFPLKVVTSQCHRAYE